MRYWLTLCFIGCVCWNVCRLTSNYLVGLVLFMLDWLFVVGVALVLLMTLELLIDDLTTLVGICCLLCGCLRVWLLWIRFCCCL